MKLLKNIISLGFAYSLLVSLPAFAVDCGGSYPTVGTFSCTVPAGVTSIVATVAGGAGGFGSNSSTATGGQGGQGGVCPNATIATTPGQTITINIGGSNSGNGGNAQISGAGIGGVIVNAFGGTGGGDASGSTPGSGGIGGAASGNSSCRAGNNGFNGNVTASNNAPSSAGSPGFVSLTLPTPVAPAAIPTLGEWGMIFMASLMAMFGIRRMRRNK